MRQSIESMIEVLQAYKDGKVIERACHEAEDWEEIYHDAPQWDFDKFQYRIAPEPKKKVKYLCWDDDGYLRWVVEESPVSLDWIHVPSEDKEIEI